MSDLIDIQTAIGGTTLEESVKALQDVFADHDLAEKGEPMSDLISRKAALRTDYFGDGHEGLRAFHSYHDYRLMREYLESLPTIDAVQVVRCKDCEYFSEPNSFSGKCTLRGDYIFTNDFCSYAVERRTDAQMMEGGQE